MGKDGNYWEYEGEVDEEGLACGNGTSKGGYDGEETYVGTWLQDQRDGIGKWSES